MPAEGGEPEAATEARRFADLVQRTVFAAIFAVIAFAALWFGGVWSAGFAIAAGLVMVWEWRRIALPAGRGPDIAAIQALAVAGAAAATWLGGPAPGFLFLFALAAVGWLADRYFDRPGFWSFIGAIYIGLGLCLFILLRETPEQGLGAVVWLALVVIATDIGAYFAGRLIGGPKLWPRVSPGKTWSGAVGGVAAAVFVAVLFRIGAGETPTGLSALAAAVLSAVSQGGDLAESAYKRKFGVKDSGRILPGHGGLLDRLDGLLAATIVLGMIALTRPNDPVWAW